MLQYTSLADDYYVNLALNTEMDLGGNREPILHFAEQLQKKFPDLRNFYARNKHDFMLEGDKSEAQYRWCSIESRRLGSGVVNPEKYEAALEQHYHALDVAQYALSISPLDCDALDFLVGFDFSYRGNHNQLVTEALGTCPAFENLAQVPGTSFINHEPSITLAIDEDCRLQVRVNVETRTNPTQIRSGEFTEDQLSVYVTARRYGSLEPGMNYAEAIEQLERICRDFLDNYVASSVLEPLARTISLK